MLLIPAVSCSLRTAAQSKNVMPPMSQSILDHPDTMEILSLQPHIGPMKSTDPAFNYYGCRILGRVAVIAEQDRVRKELRSLLAGWNGAVAACGFSPRHAIVAKKGADLLELLICFECGDLRIESPVGEAQYLHISERKAGVFDEILTKAGVPLAPK
ncbi:MAG: hypothetical protein ACKVS6_03475 [Planctomycetota bacterium]